MSKKDLVELEMFSEIAGQNIGSIAALEYLFQNSGKIDPENTIHNTIFLFTLAANNIVGEKIKILFLDVCDSNVTKMQACLSGLYLKIISPKEIHNAIDGHKDLDIDKLINKLKKKVPSFVETTPKSLQL
ncbi:MAG: hypothetical protein AAF182_02990 [Pseudomonadota bacterium]